MSNRCSNTGSRKRTRSTSSASRMSVVEVENPRVQVKRALVPIHASQHSKPISLMESGVKGPEDRSTRGLRSAKSSRKIANLIRSLFAVLLFTVFFLPYFVHLLPSTKDLRAVICRQPVGWVARRSGFLCTPNEDSATSAAMADALGNVLQDFEELHEVAMGLSPLWSRFEHAQNQLEDAMFATRYSRYVGCQQTADVIDGYRRDVSKVSRALRGFFHNVTHVAEILSINTYYTVERIEKNAKLNFLQRYWDTVTSSRPDAMVQFGKTLRGNFDETSALFLGGMGTLRDLDALNTKWEELRLCRDADIQTIQQGLTSAERWIYFWRMPKRSYWYADRRKALKALSSFEGVYTEDARIAVQKLMDLAKDVSWHLFEAEEAIQSGKWRHSTLKHQVLVPLNGLALSLQQLALTLKQDRAHNIVELTEGIKSGHYGAKEGIPKMTPGS